MYLRPRPSDAGLYRSESKEVVDWRRSLSRRRSPSSPERSALSPRSAPARLTNRRRPFWTGQWQSRPSLITKRRFPEDRRPVPGHVPLIYAFLSLRRVRRGVRSVDRSRTSSPVCGESRLRGGQRLSRHEGVRGSVGVVHPLGRRFFVGAHAEGLTNVSRWTATLDQVPVWTAPRFAAVLGVDVGIHSAERGDVTSR